MINISIARFIDRYIGILLCAIMDYYGRLTGKRKENILLEEAKKILVVKFWGLGNLVEATPAFRAIRERFPEAEITFLTLARNHGLFDAYPRFDRIIYMRDGSIADVMAEFFRLPRVLRRKGFDVVFDMDPIGRFCALVTFLSGAPIRMGFTTRSRHRERLYTRVVHLNEDQHVRKIFLDLLKCVGIEGAGIELDKIPVSDETKKSVGELFRNEGITAGDRIVCVNVNASEVAYQRRWPAENFARLADEIAGRTGAKIVLTGAPSEVEYVNSVAVLMKQAPVNIAGRTSLAQMVDVAGRCALFISNDSGPLHMAVAMGAPTVSFFGPETPKRYGPIGEKHTILYSDGDCSPCISFTNEKRVVCGKDAECVKSITVEQALDAVLKQLG